MRLLPETAREVNRLGIALKEAVFDAGFHPGPTGQALVETGAQVFIVGTHHPGSRRTRRRLARFLVGCERRISHLKRQYGAGRSRLRGSDGAQIWEGWAVFAYDLYTLTRISAHRQRTPPFDGPSGPASTKTSSARLHRHAAIARRPILRVPVFPGEVAS